MWFLDPESSFEIKPSTNAMQMENACKSENEESKATEYTPGLKGEKLNAGWFSWSWSFPCS